MLAYMLITFIVPFIVLIFAMPFYISWLTSKGMLVDDAHKLDKKKVPSPAGPLLFVCFLLGELVSYFLFNSYLPLVLILVGLISFTIGIIDDFFVLGGKTKPLLLILASVPIVVFQLFFKNVYVPRLYFPLVGGTGEHFTIYTLLVLAAIPVVSNAFNMMDSFNGQISVFATVVSASLLISVTIKYFFTESFPPVRVAITLPLIAVSAGFLIFNRYPSRIFDGDSGSLMLGSIFASLAIIDGVELSSLVAIIPAVLNSFYILSTIRGFIERRKMRYRPTFLGEDGLIYASNEKDAPLTLARLILIQGPMHEKKLVSEIAKLALFSSILSIITSLLTWV